MFIPEWLLRVFGHKIAEKLNLQEGNVPTKPWWQSKTVLSNIVMGILGVWGSLVANGVHLPSVPAWVITLLSAVGIYGRVTADTQIG